MIWVNGPVAGIEEGKRIENWTKIGPDSWCQSIGPLRVIGTDPVMLPEEIEHMELHDLPPAPTEGSQVWRELA